jgi:subfamily B ATP-binding cassette protein MsbA
VGRSGGGKTTMVNLLPRFYELQQGQVLLDGVDIRSLPLANLREQFSLVSQDVILFNDTVFNNIAYGVLRNSSEEDVIKAAIAAHAWDFIQQLPEGLQSEIGDRGVRLSGGQRQRLAIARAILKNAPILLLDEATSALDTESEQHVQAALDTLMENRTSIVIAHRLSTIENADRIMVMEQGRIVESGTHDELIQHEGHYAKLYQKQFS